MIRRDMPQVLKIESQSFEFNWAEDDFKECLKQRNCIGMVAEHDERIVGFMIYELQKDSFEILNFAVDPAFRRLAVGRQMIDKLRGKLSQQRRRELHVKVRDSNLEAQLFFRSCGLVAVGVEREYYTDYCGDDAYVFSYLMDGSDGEWS